MPLTESQRRIKILRGLASQDPRIREAAMQQATEYEGPAVYKYEIKQVAEYQLRKFAGELPAKYYDPFAETQEARYAAIRAAEEEKIARARAVEAAKPPPKVEEPSRIAPQQREVLDFLRTGLPAGPLREAIPTRKPTPISQAVARANLAMREGIIIKSEERYWRKKEARKFEPEIRVGRPPLITEKPEERIQPDLPITIEAKPEPERVKDIGTLAMGMWETVSAPSKIVEELIYKAGEAAVYYPLGALKTIQYGTGAAIEMEKVEVKKMQAAVGTAFQIGTLFIPGPVGKIRYISAALAAETPIEAGVGITLGAGFGLVARGAGIGSRAAKLMLGEGAAYKAYRAGEVAISKGIIPGFFLGMGAMRGLEIGGAIQAEEFERAQQLSRETAAGFGAFMVGAGVIAPYVGERAFGQPEAKLSIKEATAKLTSAEKLKFERYLKTAKALEGKEVAARSLKSQIESVKHLPKGKATDIVYKQILKNKGKWIVGGGTGTRTQLRVSSPRPNDVDIYSSNPRASARAMYDALIRVGVKRVSVPRGNEITIAGKKAIDFHPKEMLWFNIDTTRGYFQPRSASITKTPEGIRVLKITTQMKRNVIAALLESRPRDLQKFELIRQTLKKSEFEKIAPRKIGQQRLKKPIVSELERGIVAAPIVKAYDYYPAPKALAPPYYAADISKAYEGVPYKADYKGIYDALYKGPAAAPYKEIAYKPPKFPAYKPPYKPTKKPPYVPTAAVYKPPPPYKKIPRYELPPGYKIPTYKLLPSYKPPPPVYKPPPTYKKIPTYKPPPYKPPPGIIVIPSAVSVKRKPKEKRVRGYDTYIKRRLLKKGKGSYLSRGYRKAPGKPQERKAALGRGAAIVDEYTNKSFFIRRSKRTAKQNPSLAREWAVRSHKFRAKKKNPNVLVERDFAAIDSFSEKLGIPYESLRLRKAGVIPYKKQRSRRRGRLKPSIGRSNLLKLFGG